MKMEKPSAGSELGPASPSKRACRSSTPRTPTPTSVHTPALFRSLLDLFPPHNELSLVPRGDSADSHTNTSNFFHQCSHIFTHPSNMCLAGGQAWTDQPRNAARLSRPQADGVSAWPEPLQMPRLGPDRPTEAVGGGEGGQAVVRGLGPKAGSARSQHCGLGCVSGDFWGSQPSPAGAEAPLTRAAQGHRPPMTLCWWRIYRHVNASPPAHLRGQTG